ENANKFERFIFDLIRYTDKVLLVETPRDEEFCPIKSVEGDETLAKAQQFMSNLYGKWLRKCGLDVPTDSHGNVVGVIEISPLFALDEEELKEKIPSVGKFTGSLCLEP
ncbi:MAG: UDPGP type 1 family protein, partial [Planctomycetota bacterium]|nr:UDPGP type 1 family protein [Planctomycetota bacterium]